MSQTVIERSPPGLTRAFAFTLATALAWMGHDCKGGCPALTTTMPASVWFVRDPVPADHAWPDILVIVDLGDHCASTEQIRALLREVNQCTAGSNIAVYERASTEHAQPVFEATEAPVTPSVLYFWRPTDSALARGGRA